MPSSTSESSCKLGGGGEGEEEIRLTRESGRERLCTCYPQKIHPVSSYSNLSGYSPLSVQEGGGGGPAVCECAYVSMVQVCVVKINKLT